MLPSTAADVQQQGSVRQGLTLRVVRRPYHRSGLDHAARASMKAGGPWPAEALSRLTSLLALLLSCSFYAIGAQGVATMTIGELRYCGELRAVVWRFHCCAASQRGPGPE